MSDLFNRFAHSARPMSRGCGGNTSKQRRQTEVGDLTRHWAAGPTIGNQLRGGVGQIGCRKASKVIAKQPLAPFKIGLRDPRRAKMTPKGSQEVIWKPRLPPDGRPKGQKGGPETPRGGPWARQGTFLAPFWEPKWSQKVMSVIL